jgi:polysaccharide export outer membrane protein
MGANIMRILREAVFALILCVAAAVPLAAAAQAAAPPKASSAPAATSVAPPVVPAQGAAAAPSGAQGDTSAAEYVIGPEDTIEVEVVGQPDRARARVYTDGSVQLNLIGRVPAAGRTPRELATQVAAALKTGGFYANPVVNVEVVGFSSRYVTVLGAVVSPSLVPINRSYHLSEILARVGGVRGDAAEYLVVRPEKGEEKRYSIKKLSAGDPADDPLVTPGDKIFAPPAEVFYISGQVKSPGTFPIREGMTIAQAIAKGGGLTDSGNGKRVTVTRGGKTLKLDANEKVLPEDVLVVGEKLF